MKKYVTQVGNVQKQSMEKQPTTKSSQIENKKKKKKLQNKITYESDTLSESRIEQELDLEPEPRGEQLQQDNPSLPTKN